MNTKAPDVIVTRYFAKGGYATRFWTIYLNGELLAVTVYRHRSEAGWLRAMDMILLGIAFHLGRTTH